MRVNCTYFVGAVLFCLHITLNSAPYCTSRWLTTSSSISYRLCMCHHFASTRTWCFEKMLHWYIHHSYKRLWCSVLKGGNNITFQLVQAITSRELSSVPWNGRSPGWEVAGSPLPSAVTVCVARCRLPELGGPTSLLWGGARVFCYSDVVVVHAR